MLPRTDSQNPEFTDQKSIEHLGQQTVEIAFRVFQLQYTEDTLQIFERQVLSIAEFQKKFPTTKIVIVTADDIPLAWEQVLSHHHLHVLKTAIRNEHEKLSYANMLNATTQDHEAPDYILFASSDYARRADELMHESTAIQQILLEIPESLRTRVSIIGAALAGVHSLQLIEEIVFAQRDVDLSSLPLVFPNNAVAMVPKGATFSNKTDNGRMGEIDVPSETATDRVEIGGNEDFYYALRSMIFENKVCILVTDPIISGDRVGEVSGHDKKKIRRQAVYQYYAKLLVEEAIERGVIKPPETGPVDDLLLDEIIKDILDVHLFFARKDEHHHTHIQLTRRQIQKGILTPFPPRLRNA